MVPQLPSRLAKLHAPRFVIPGSVGPGSLDPWINQVDCVVITVFYSARSMYVVVRRLIKAEGIRTLDGVDDKRGFPGASGKGARMMVGPGNGPWQKKPVSKDSQVNGYYVLR